MSDDLENGLFRTPDGMRGLAIREVAEQTGLTAGTIRAWERRYGVPDPERTPSGYRVYNEGDVVVLKRVAAMRKEGVPLPAAFDRARSRPAGESISFFGIVPNDGRARVLRKRTLLAISRAIEDATMAVAGAPVVLGAFQREFNYRAVEHRYRRIGATADEAVVFADFENPCDSCCPVEVPIATGTPATHEWAVVVDAPGFTVCLVAWELPERTRPQADGDRRFEAFWTLDPDVVRRASNAGVAVARAKAPAVADRLEAALADRPLGSEPRIEALEGLTHRMVAYLEAN